MKRTIQICILLLLCAALLACVEMDTETRELVAVSAPEEQDVTLTLPLVRNGEATKLLQDYTDGFVSGSGKLLTFSTETEDPGVALSTLFADGTLCILAMKEGKTVVRVTAISETGESATARVNVTVNSGRRIAALLLVGILSVVLLILFGKPNGKKPAPKEPEPVAEAEPEKTPEEASEKPEAEQNYIILPERSSKE